DETFLPRSALRLRTKRTASPLPAQRPELLAEILLPPAARKWIREQGPDCLIVVPDGALHKLPLEALPLRTDGSPSYVLDELPPLVPAPSGAILARLLARAPAPVGPRSLLTVAPAYPQPAKGPAAAADGLWGRLVHLENARKESECIRGFFAPEQ